MSWYNPWSEARRLRRELADVKAKLIFLETWYGYVEDKLADAEDELKKWKPRRDEKTGRFLRRERAVRGDQETERAVRGDQ